MMLPHRFHYLFTISSASSDATQVIQNPNLPSSNSYIIRQLHNIQCIWSNSIFFSRNQFHHGASSQKRSSAYPSPLAGMRVQEIQWYFYHYRWLCIFETFIDTLFLTLVYFIRHVSHFQSFANTLVITCPGTSENKVKGVTLHMWSLIPRSIPRPALRTYHDVHILPKSSIGCRMECYHPDGMNPIEPPPSWSDFLHYSCRTQHRHFTRLLDTPVLNEIWQ